MWNTKMLFVAFCLCKAPEYLQFRPSEAQIYLGQIRSAETRDELKFLLFPNTQVSDLNGDYVLINNDSNIEKSLSLSVTKDPLNITVGEQSETDEIFALTLHYLIGQLSQDKDRDMMLKSVLTNKVMKQSFALLDSHHDKSLKPGWVQNYLNAGLVNKSYHFSSSRSFPSRSIGSFIGLSSNYLTQPLWASSFFVLCLALSAKEFCMQIYIFLNNLMYV